jgi:uncharacterized membrane protein
MGIVERLATALGGGALIGAGLARPTPAHFALAGLGSMLVARAAVGHSYLYDQIGFSTADPESQAVEIVQSVTVMRPREEVYAFWRDLENLPRFMAHIASVETLSEGRSRWVAAGPGLAPDLEWEAEIVQENPGRVLAWQSLPESDIDHSGHVRFIDAPHGGTEVHARIAYRPPAGTVGAAVARALDPILGQLIKEDIRRFKHLAEAGEIPTIDGQSSGRD